MNDERHDDFDRSLRALHAQAVAQVPPRTLHQLQVRRANAAGRAVPAGQGRPANRGWWLAAAAAAVFALAIGLRQPGLEPAPAPVDAPALAAVAGSAPAAGYEEGLVTLEEDPDLYLWLAAQDSQMLAME